MSNIPNICENLYLSLLKEIPQFSNNNLTWFINGSVLCNILANVECINNEYVSNELKSKFESFVRNPKGDIDICYIANQTYKFDLSSKEVLDFYSISEEKRTYNFIDHNSIITDEDILQLCKYRTVNGLEFYAKLPQYIFLYKFMEFVSVFHDDISSGNLALVIAKRKNIIRDVKKLLEISNIYFGRENTKKLLFDELKHTSNYFCELFINNENSYNYLIDSTFNQFK